MVSIILAIGFFWNQFGFHGVSIHFYRAIAFVWCSIRDATSFHNDHMSNAFLDLTNLKRLCVDLLS